MTRNTREISTPANRRRTKEEPYNAENGIERRTVIREIDDSLATILKGEYADLTENPQPKT